MQRVGTKIQSNHSVIDLLRGDSIRDARDSVDCPPQKNSDEAPLSCAERLNS
jgi:hypothetical protein